MISRAQRLLLPTARTRVGDRFFRWCYKATLRIVVADLRRDAAVSAIVMRSALDNPWFRPLLSDIDLLLVCRDDAPAQEAGRRERIQRRLRMWKRVFPHFQGGWIAKESAMSQRENDVVAAYVVLDDASVLHGEFDRDRLLRLYRPQASIVRYRKAVWLYAATVHHLLYMPLAQRRLLNCDKVFAKVLVFAGYGWDEAQATILQLFGGIGLPNAPNRLEEATPELQRLLTAKLRELPPAQRPGSFTINVDGDIRPLPSSAPAPVSIKEAPWAQRLVTAMEGQAPGFKIHLYRTTEGSNSLIAFAEFPPERLHADAIHLLVDLWKHMESEQRSAGTLSGFLPSPIIVDPQLMRLCLQLNIRECNQTWQSYVRLEPL